MKTNIMMIIFAVAALLIAGCSDGDRQVPVDDIEARPQMANPASTNCIDKGGSLELVTDESGGQKGMCTLKDGTVCEEWAYFRGECKEDSPDRDECGECPILSPPSPSFCTDGNIVSGGTDECGCNSPPKCERSAQDDVAVACTEEAKLCPDGTAVGRTGPNCEFAPCGSETKVEEKQYCAPESRNVDACTMDYNPVCGWFNSNVNCVKYPCAITASNVCGACRNPDVEYWTPGECPK